MEFAPYRHKAQYYETDTMKIVHHSNYIRWMEEARVDLLEQMGLGYDKMEIEGVLMKASKTNQPGFCIAPKTFYPIDR